MTNRAANYTEELVSALVTTQLTIMSFPIFNVQIVPFSSNFENLFGADAKIPGSAKIAPFYMQFKRPTRSTRTGKISRDRAALSLSCATDSLHFNLRKKAKHDAPVHKLQHNVLYRMRERLLKRGIGDAAYVCSLYLSSGEYVRSAQLNGLRRWPFYWLDGPYLNRTVVIHGATPVSLLGVPWLEGHVSIPPHATVASASHSYSFDPFGGEVCFHSPHLIEHNRRPLPEWIGQLAEQFRSKDAPTFARSDELLADLRNVSGIEEAPGESQKSSSGWMAFGDVLEERHGISQFAFVSEA